MNELKIFNNEEFGQVRWIKINEKDYAVGIDIAKSLGYKNPNDAISRHCKGYVKHAAPTNRGIQQMNVITEGDIYRLTAKSELPGAEKFESWIFDKVLPAIRKHGMYATDELLDNPDLLIQVATKLKEEKARNKILEEEKKNNEPKVIFADAVSASHTSILVGELAKILKQNNVDMGQNKLFQWLRDNSYLTKRKGTDYNMPTQKSMELGLFEIKETSINHSDGHSTINKTPKVSGKGQIYFIEKFSKEMIFQ